MFVDTSAIVAILLGEGDAGVLSASSRRRASDLAAVRLDMHGAAGERCTALRAQHYFDCLASQMRWIEVADRRAIGRLAVECFERFGKGRHPARLNFGDCLSYACAKAHGARLLFKGDDFAQTDVNLD